MGFVDTTTLRSFSGDKMQKLNVFETPDMFCDVYCLEPGQSQKPHSHAAATKFYYVIEGRGTIQIGDRNELLGPGGLAYATPGEPHGVTNTSAERMVLLVAMSPNPNAASG
jgi:quercetin dioxygenase-like cupin family protein